MSARSDTVACAQRNEGHLWDRVREVPARVILGFHCNGSFRMRCSGCKVTVHGETPAAVAEQASRLDRSNRAGRAI